MNQIDAFKLIKRISGNWYFYTVLMILGGFTGLLISNFNPPVYESSAVFSVTIDYTQTGALTDIQEDQAMRGIGSVILSDQVVTETLAQVNNKTDLELNQSDFLENSYLDREDFRWTLRFRDPDPKKAETVIDFWSNSANSILQDALSHSLTSSALLNIQQDMTACLQESPAENGQGYCGYKNIVTLINSITEISSRIQIEKAASLGLFSPLSVSLVTGGGVSQSAVLGQRNLLVISGALIGLLSGFITILIWIMKRSPSI